MRLTDFIVYFGAALLGLVVASVAVKDEWPKYIKLTFRTSVAILLFLLVGIYWLFTGEKIDETIYRSVLCRIYPIGERCAPKKIVASTTAEEIAFWKSIENKSEPTLFSKYLAQYPYGTYAHLAREKLQQNSKKREESHFLLSKLAATWPNPGRTNCDTLAPIDGDILSINGGRIHDFTSDEPQGYTPRAAEECRAAMAAHPETPRFGYQYGCVIGDCNTSHQVSGGVKKSFGLVRKAAEMGYPAAQINLACMLDLAPPKEQPKLKQLFQKGLETYELVANTGNTYAMARIGWIYQFCFENKLDIALSWFERAASLGHHEVAFYLGITHKDGRWSQTLQPNWQEALRWFEESSAGGNPDADIYLGLIYSGAFGATGIPTDPATAGAAYLRAVERKQPYAIDHISSPSASLPMRLYIEKQLYAMGKNTGDVDGVIDEKTKAVLRDMAK